MAHLPIALHSHDSSLFHSIAWYSLNKIYPWKTVYPWPSHWCHFSPHSHCSDSVKRLKRSKGRWLYKILKLPKKAVAFFNVFVWHPKRSGNVVNPIINPQFHRGWWKCNPFLWWFWGWLALAAFPRSPHGLFALSVPLSSVGPRSLWKTHQAKRKRRPTIPTELATGVSRIRTCFPCFIWLNMV